MTAPLLHPLSTGEILDVSFGLYRTLFPQLILVSLATTAGPLVLGTYVTVAGGMLVNPLLGSLNVLLALVLNAVATAATVFIVSESYLGRSLTAGAALGRAMPFIGRLISLALLTGLVVGIGLLLLLVPGLLFLAGLILAIPALVLEGSPSALEGMSRAWGLSRGFRRRVLTVAGTVLLLVYLPSLAAGMMMPAFADPGALLAGEAPLGLPLLLLTTLSGALQLVIFPFFYCALTVLYYDLRVRKEGFDLEILAAGLQPA